LQAQQSQPRLSLARIRRPVTEGSSVVGDFHADTISSFADGHRHAAGARVFGNIGQAFLGNAKQHRLLLVVQALGQRVALKPHSQSGAPGKPLEIGAQRRQQSQLVQYGGPQLAREIMHRPHGGLQQALGLRQPPVFAAVIRGAFLFQPRQRHTDGDQRLADLIVQLPADALAFLLLDPQHLIRKAPQVLLHAARLVKHPLQMALALAQGRFLAFPVGNLHLEFPIDPRQLDVALFQRGDELLQLQIRFPKSAVRDLERRQGFQKKRARRPKSKRPHVPDAEHRKAIIEYLQRNDPIDKRGTSAK
jgi:hypothetical protein